MARKNLLSGQTPTPDEEAGSAVATNGAGQGTAPHFGVMGTRGAIGAVTRSIENLKAHSVVDLQPDLIEASFITDRLEASSEAHGELVASIRKHGQQVPILVRPHPDREGRFQIAYGRRRLAALTELGQPVRAIVKVLTDQDLVIAQGQENSARTDLSFIEKALFARKLEEGGFDRETIMASLSVDKTTLSRLISSVTKIPLSIIEAIGPAPKAGRDRWTEMAARLDAAAAVTKAQSAIQTFGSKTTDERFEAVFSAVAPKRAKPPRMVLIRAGDGTKVAQVKEDAERLVLAIDKKSSGAFGAYLREQLPEIFAAFKRSEEPRN